MSTQLMRALEVSSKAGPETIALVERPVPSPGPREVLIRVAAAGLNFADVMQSRGLYPGGPEPPYLAGLEAAGEIVEVGDEVDGWFVGDQVMGFGSSAFAEYVAWPARALLGVPHDWTMTQAAAFPIQWLTAHACLRTVGRLRAEESVLVHAAAGGVGSAAVRLAKHFGARVFATASTAEKLDYARQLGADVTINYREEEFADVVLAETNGQGVDLVLEMVGGKTFKENLRCVRPYGRVVVFGSASAKAAGIHNVGLVFQPIEVLGYHLVVMMRKRPDLFAQQLEEVGKLIEEGAITPDEPLTYSLANGVEALLALENRETLGKLVLVP